jgi:hypothetical protein
MAKRASGAGFVLFGEWRGVRGGGGGRGSGFGGGVVPFSMEGGIWMLNWWTGGLTVAFGVRRLDSRYDGDEGCVWC